MTEQEHQCPHNDVIIEALGRSGKNGRLGECEKDIREMRADIQKVRAVQLKLIIWTAIAAGGSSAAATAVFKLLA